MYLSIKSLRERLITYFLRSVFKLWFDGGEIGSISLWRGGPGGVPRPRHERAVRILSAHLAPGFHGIPLGFGGHIRLARARIRREPQR